MPMRMRVGTSGFAYKEWRGSFYPEELPDAKMLDYYAKRFDTVEINNTFYRMPKASMLENWTKQVGPDFSFVLKAVTYLVSMKDEEKRASATKAFFETAKAMGKSLGPVLVQLPHTLEKDLDRIRALFDLVPKDVRIALDVGRASWLADDTYALLRERGASLCIVDDPNKKVPIVPTARWGYVRLRGVDYKRGELDAWVQRILEQPWEEVFVFFKHEDAATGPKLGAQFQKLFAARASRK